LAAGGAAAGAGRATWAPHAPQNCADGSSGFPQLPQNVGLPAIIAGPIIFDGLAVRKSGQAREMRA
jgi:hypothetical protein